LFVPGFYVAVNGNVRHDILILFKMCKRLLYLAYLHNLMGS